MTQSSGISKRHLVSAWLCGRTARACPWRRGTAKWREIGEASCSASSTRRGETAGAWHIYSHSLWQSGAIVGRRERHNVLVRSIIFSAASSNVSFLFLIPPPETFFRFQPNVDWTDNEQNSNVQTSSSVPNFVTICWIILKIRKYGRADR
jgi:hypothetical protein